MVEPSGSGRPPRASTWGPGGLAGEDWRARGGLRSSTLPTDRENMFHRHARVFPGDHHREEIQNRLCLAVVEIATGEFINGWMITKGSPRSQTWRADRRMKVARDLLR